MEFPAGQQLDGWGEYRESPCRESRTIARDVFSREWFIDRTISRTRHPLTAQRYRPLRSGRWQIVWTLFQPSPWATERVAERGAHRGRGAAILPARKRKWTRSWDYHRVGRLPLRGSNDFRRPGRRRASVGKF